MERRIVLVIASAAAFIAGTALAATTNIATRPLSSTIVTLSGTVERITNDDEFTLRDEHGRFEVSIAPGKEPVLNEGDHVIVTGALNKKMPQDIEAYSVQVHQRADL